MKSVAIVFPVPCAPATITVAGFPWITLRSDGLVPPIRLFGLVDADALAVGIRVRGRV